MVDGQTSIEIKLKSTHVDRETDEMVTVVEIDGDEHVNREPLDEYFQVDEMWTREDQFVIIKEGQRIETPIPDDLINE